VPAAGRVSRLQVTDITMVPRPLHLPVDIWMPIASGKTIDMMARYGLKAMVTLNGAKILDDVVRAYHAACERHGRPKKLGEDMIWGAGVYLANSQEEAIRKLEPAHDEALQVVRTVRLRALCRRAGPHLGHARRAGTNTVVARRRRAEGLVLRPASPGDRRHQVDRGEISGVGEFHDPLGRGPWTEGIQGAAQLVRQGRHAGVSRGHKSIRGHCRA